MLNISIWNWNVKSHEKWRWNLRSQWKRDINRKNSLEFSRDQTAVNVECSCIACSAAINGILDGYMAIKLFRYILLSEPRPFSRAGPQFRARTRVSTHIRIHFICCGGDVTRKLRKIKKYTDWDRIDREQSVLNIRWTVSLRWQTCVH